MGPRSTNECIDQLDKPSALKTVPRGVAQCLPASRGGGVGWGQWLGGGWGLPGWMHSTLYGVSGKVGAELSERIEVILPRTINSCNLHLNELDSLNLALLKWVKGHGTPIISIISWGSSPSWW